MNWSRPLDSHLKQVADSNTCERYLDVSKVRDPK
jgi:hypothetical protein